jgi:hypothetical protein
LREDIGVGLVNRQINAGIDIGWIGIRVVAGIYFTTGPLSNAHRVGNAWRSRSRIVIDIDRQRDRWI